MANKKKFDWGAALIPGYGHYKWIKNIFDNVKKDGFQGSDLLGFLKTTDEPKDSTVSDTITDSFNNHNIASEPDVNGYQQVEVTPSDPTSSASNVINYDPNKTAQENLLQYAQDNNSASAYDAFLQNKHEEELSNSAIGRAIADAEANGISKYQLFQSGNAAAASPSSAASSYRSYEDAMNRRSSWNEKELAALTAIIATTVSSAMKMIK